MAYSKDVIRRHEILRDFFVKVLAVDELNADKAACQMEHSIPKVILERFIQFAEFVEVCPRAGSKWIAGFGYYCDHGNTLENCEKCISVALEEVRQRRQQGGLKTMETSRLKDLKPGQKGKVLKINVRGEVNKRIVEMGITPGAVVEVEREFNLSYMDRLPEGNQVTSGRWDEGGASVEPSPILLFSIRRADGSTFTRC
ncbi:MAG TPA: hypothetical protein EYP06_00030 [Desulfobacterales bacterium]|nr:hypothetical protein [Desulfobacterales bacterium]